MNSTRISQAWLKATESFSLSPTHSWLSGVVVVWVQMQQLLGFFGKKSGLISLILNTKSEKHDCLCFVHDMQEWTIGNSVSPSTNMLGVKGQLSNPNLSAESNNAASTFLFVGQISNHKIYTTFKCNLIETKIVFMDFARKDKLSTTGSWAFHCWMSAFISDIPKREHRVKSRDEVHYVCIHWEVSATVKTAIGLLTSRSKSVDLAARPVDCSPKTNGLGILVPGQNNVTKQDLKYMQLSPNYVLRKSVCKNWCALLPDA